MRRLLGEEQIQQTFSVTLATMDKGKGTQAHMLLNCDLAYTTLETARAEANVPKESGTTSQGETGIGQQGKEGHT